MADRILVIDDDEELAELLGILFMKKGYDTEVAFSGRAALQKAEEFKPAVIIQDYMLPDINGVRLMEELKRLNPDAFVIVVTARGTEDVAVEMLKAGASDYIRKPFDTENLLNAVEKLLRLRSSQFECNRLESEIRRQNSELLGINALSAALTSSMSRDSKCGSAVDIIMNNMRADMVNVFVLGQDGTGLSLTASNSLVGEGLSAVDAPAGSGLAAYISETKKPTVVADITKEKRFRVPGKVLEKGMTSALAVPMMYRDEFRGVVEVYTKPSRTFPSFDIKLLSSFANLIALTLENESVFGSLGRADRLWQSTSDIIPDSIAVIDAGHRIIRVNMAAAESAGHPISELVGQRCCWMFHNTMEPLKDCPVDEVFATRKHVSRRLELGGRPYQVEAYPVFNEDGRIEMVVERASKLDG